MKFWPLLVCAVVATAAGGYVEAQSNTRKGNQGALTELEMQVLADQMTNEVMKKPADSVTTAVPVNQAFGDSLAPQPNVWVDSFPNVSREEAMRQCAQLPNDAGTTWIHNFVSQPLDYSRASEVNHSLSQVVTSRPQFSAWIRTSDNAFGLDPAMEEQGYTHFACNGSRFEVVTWKCNGQDCPLENTLLLGNKPNVTLVHDYFCGSIAYRCTKAGGWGTFTNDRTVRFRAAGSLWEKFGWNGEVVPPGQDQGHISHHSAPYSVN